MLRKDRVFIIIVSYNGQEYWPGLLPLLTQERYNDFDVNILIVDNNSQDDSVSYIKKYFP